MRRRRKRRQLKRIYLIWLLIAATIFAVFFIQTEKALEPVARTRGEHFAKQLATELVTKSVSDYLSDNRFTYDDFSAVLYDDKKRPVSVEAIPYTINKVQSELTYAINRRFEEAGKKEAHIPLGSLIDSPVFIGRGPAVRIRVCPDGTAEVKIKSDLSEAGVNQTCHRISAVITVKMTSSVPMYSFETVTEFEFVLAECVIVGEVPNIAPYIGNSNPVQNKTA